MPCPAVSHRNSLAFSCEAGISKPTCMTSTHIAQTSPKHLTNTAPSRGLSPVRSSRISSSTQRMPSPRSSPAIRPQSPLSPRYESSSQRFEPLQPPSPRNMNSRTGNSQRRANTNTLKLPALPRFHPANFQSTNSSTVNTPDSNVGSPQPPASPRTHQRVISDAQKQLLYYQREMISVAHRSSTPTQMDNPASPRLAPMGSPGPVTPLELEAEDEYLSAGARSSGRTDAVQPDELVHKLIEEEAARRRKASKSPSRPMGR